MNDILEDLERLEVELESIPVDQDIVGHSWSGDPIYANDPRCTCDSPVRRQSLDVERALTSIKTRQRSRKREVATLLIKSYFAPRIAQFKEFHCVSHSYLMQRFDLSKTDVVEGMRVLRTKSVVHMIYPPSEFTSRPPMYKVHEMMVAPDLKCGACHAYHDDIFVRREDRCELTSSIPQDLS